MSNSIPKDCYVWRSDNCILDAGSLKPKNSLDVTQVNIAIELNGVITSKRFELTLTDKNDPSRVFVSKSAPVTLSGLHVGFITFEFTGLHVTPADSYGVKFCVDDSTGFTFGLIADWLPYVNEHSYTQQVPGPRIELYGVESGLHAC